MRNLYPISQWPPEIMRFTSLWQGASMSKWRGLKPRPLARAEEFSGALTCILQGEIVVWDSNG